jgi:predicted RNase H-like nuclease (RuvC/YqgF family)
VKRENKLCGGSSQGELYHFLISELSSSSGARFSTEIQDLHDDMAELRRNKEKLQDQLRRRYGECHSEPSSRIQRSSQYLTYLDTQSLILTKGFRNGYHVLLNKKSDFAKLDKTKRFQVLSEGRSVKAYALMVSHPLMM